ncbi:hypothetical protein Trydic_g9181 [Trypoxylus dichotomus]
MNLERVGSDSTDTTTIDPSSDSTRLKKNVSFRQTYENPSSPSLSVTDIRLENTNKLLFSGMKANSAPGESPSKFNNPIHTASKTSTVSFSNPPTWEKSVQQIASASKHSLSPSLSANLYVPPAKRPKPTSRDVKLFGCIRLPTKGKLESIVTEIKPVSVVRQPSPPSPIEVHDSPIGTILKRKKRKVTRRKGSVEIEEPKDFHGLTHLKLDTPEFYALYRKKCLGGAKGNWPKHCDKLNLKSTRDQEDGEMDRPQIVGTHKSGEKRKRRKGRKTRKKRPIAKQPSKKDLTIDDVALPPPSLSTSAVEIDEKDKKLSLFDLLDRRTRSMLKLGSCVKLSDLKRLSAIDSELEGTSSAGSLAAMRMTKQKSQTAGLSTSAVELEKQKSRSEIEGLPLRLMKSDPLLSEFYSCSEDTLTVTADPFKHIWNDDSSDSEDSSARIRSAAEIDEELPPDDKPAKAYVCFRFGLLDTKVTDKDEECKDEIKDTLFRAPLWFRRRMLENDYDPYKHRRQPHLSPNIETMLHIIKSCTGTGILTMPYAFMHAGLFNGVTSTIFLMTFTTYCVNMLIKCQYIICKRNRIPMLTYPDTLVAALTVGPKFLRRFAVHSGEWDFEVKAELVALPSKYPIFFGIVLFVFNSVSTVVAIENNMQTPKSFGGFLGIWNISMMFFTILVTIVGFLGYLRYGDNVLPIFTQNLPINDRISNMARIAFAVSLLLSYGMLTYVPAKILIRRTKHLSHSVTWEYFIRISLAIIPLIIASVAPRVDIMIPLLGALCGCWLKFIVPALIELCLKCSDDLPMLRWALIIDVLIIVFGILGMIIGVYQCLINLMK